MRKIFSEKDYKIKKSFLDRNLYIIFPLPAVMFVVIMMIFPVLYTLFLSLTNWNLTSGSPFSFVGFQSYMRVLTEPRFIDAVGRTFFFTFFAVIFEVILGDGRSERQPHPRGAY